jgi:uncharacterized protein
MPDHATMKCPIPVRLIATLLAAGTSLCAQAQTPHYWELRGLDEYATLQSGVMVPMRDGVRLSTDVILPKSHAGKIPAILVRTPYERDSELDDAILAKLVMRGYALIIQNERGRGWSEGTYHFLTGAREDGYDTISWIVRQSWSNERVGTYGCSSSAEHQPGLASMNHPAHKAMVAMGLGSGIGAVPGLATQGGFYKGGVPELEMADWYGQNGEINRPVLPAALPEEERERLVARYMLAPTQEAREEQKKQVGRSIWMFPSKDILKRAGIGATDFDTMITLSPADPRWRDYGYIHDGDHPQVPALYVDAWHDYTSFGTLKLFEYVQNTPNQFLIMAPTGHCMMTQATEHTQVGELDMGDARYDYEGTVVKWFDHWLKDASNGVLDRARVQMYLMGANTWKSYPTWPAPGSVTTRLYLHSDGKANSLYGSGLLSAAMPGGESADVFVSDPRHPVPSAGGGDEDPTITNQASEEIRNDVVVYSTEALAQGLVVTGDIRVGLYVASTTPDADLAVKLVDVYPDGSAYNVSDTMLRLRYRDSFEKPTPMTPGQVYFANFTGLASSHYFAPGHRLRIHIAGSNFPFYERNLQTGGSNFDETQPRTSRIQILHDASRASYVELPVMSTK